MIEKHTYEELTHRVIELERENLKLKQTDRFEMLCQSEAFLKSLFRAAPIGIGVVVDSVFTQVNMRVCEMTGYSEEELLGKNARMLYPTDDDYEYVGREKYMQIRDRGTGMVETRWQRKDGEVINILMSSTPFDLSDLSKGVTFTALDITKRKQSEEALQDSEQKYRVLVENAGEAIFIAQDGFLKVLNKKTSSFIGYTPNELMSGPFINFVYYEDKALVMDAHIKRLQGEEIPRVYSFRIVHKSGEVRWVELNTVLIEWFNKPATLNFLRDITDRKRIEMEQEKLQARLLQAQKMEAIGTLAGGVAHDLNNILSGIINYPELMLMDIPDDSPLKKPLLTIKKSGEKAAAIVNDLLTLARRGVKIDTIVNLDEVVNEYLLSPECEQLRSHHPEVTIETEFSDGLLPIKGSRIHLSKAVMNLVSNAAEAIVKSGKIHILIENLYIDQPIGKYEQVSEGAYVALTVKDTGIGIKAKDLERIFEPFYTKKKMGRSGTGLGMAVVWGTVKDHKGYIDVQSKPGEGSRFTIYFPATRTVENISTQDDFGLECFMGKGEFVLIVDDVEEQRDISASMVKKLGYHPASVPSGEAAIEYLKNNAVDIMLLDMIMAPGINGLETYRRASKLFPDLKVIIVSGFTRSADVREAQKLGAGVYLKKPYTLESLGRAIREELVP